MTDQLIGRDTDEARRQSALRYEGRVGAFGKAANGFGDGDIFGQIEVVQSVLPGGLGDRRVAEERQARNDGARTVVTNVLVQRGAIGCVKREVRMGLFSAGHHLDVRSAAALAGTEVHADDLVGLAIKTLVSVGVVALLENLETFPAAPLVAQRQAPLRAARGILVHSWPAYARRRMSHR